MSDILLPAELLTVGLCVLAVFVLAGACCGILAFVQTHKTAKLSRWAWGETNTRLTLLQRAIEDARANGAVPMSTLPFIEMRPQPEFERPRLSLVKSEGHRAVAPPVEFINKGG